MISLNSDVNAIIAELAENTRSLVELLERGRKLTNDLIASEAIDPLLVNRASLNELSAAISPLTTVDLGLIYNSQKSSGFMQMLNYLKALAGQYHCKLIVFKISDLDLEKMIISGTVISETEIMPGTVAIPPLIYNLAMHSKKASIKKMRQLRTLAGCRVINPINRLKQDVILDILQSYPGSQQFLLPFVPLTEAKLTEYSQDCTDLFLIPETGLYHPKAIIIRHPTSETCTVSIGVNTLQCQPAELADLLRKITDNRRYILIKGVQTLLWHDLPMEARIYVQKGLTGNWNITTMLSAHQLFATASLYEHMHDLLSRTLLQTIPDLASATKKQLTDKSLNICAYLDHYLPNIGCCTLDFIFDVTGKAYLTYVSGWEQNDYLYTLDTQLWLRYVENAFYYLQHLRSMPSTV
jgi:hypothetical protein